MRRLAVAGVILVALLYARPLRSYLATKHELAGRTADVAVLKAQKRELQRRLAEANTTQALEREARRVGLVHPGERLFIVKGISRWVHTRSIRAGG